jgi:AraC-like DNA-binding protein
MMVEALLITEAAIAIRDHIAANPLSKKTASDLAAQFHVDRKKLLPVFKELTGTTIKRLQFERLMQAASEMLLLGMSVKEVAIECGYQHYQNNFTRGFREVFKTGPEEWLHNQLIERRKVTQKHSSNKVHS